MANTLGLVESNFGEDDRTMFIHPPLMWLKFGPTATPVFVGLMGTKKVIRVKQDFKSFKIGIPRVERRRDLIEQEVSIESTLYQFQKETVALSLQRTIDTTDDTYDRVLIGTGVPPMTYPSAILIGKNVNHEEIRLFIRKYQISVETWELLWGEDDYGTIPFNGIALQDPNPLVTQPDWAYNPNKADEDNIAYFAFPKAA